jgi:hypothetical protein
MKERGILFSGAMVRALLAGTKTQTRRVVKQQDGVEADDDGPIYVHSPRCPGYCDYACPGHDLHGIGQSSPYGVPGDRLWVRETWCSCQRPTATAAGAPSSTADETFVQGGQQHAKGPHFNAEWEGPGPQTYRWRPSIFMPRWQPRASPWR